MVPISGTRKNYLKFGANLGRQHLQRYLDEIIWRWNHRAPVREVVKQWTTKAGVEREKTTTIWKPTPVIDQMRVLLQGAVREAAAALEGIRAMLALMAALYTYGAVERFRDRSAMAAPSPY